MQLQSRYDAQVGKNTGEDAALRRRRRAQVLSISAEIPTSIIAPTTFASSSVVPTLQEEEDTELPSNLNDQSDSSAIWMHASAIDCSDASGSLTPSEAGALWHVLPDEAAVLAHRLLQEPKLCSVLQASAPSIHRISSLSQGLALNLVYHLGDPVSKVRSRSAECASWLPGHASIALDRV